MFGEIRAREEAYRTEFSSYLSAGASEDDLWPKLAAGEPTAKVWSPPQESQAVINDAAKQLGVKPAALSDALSIRWPSPCPNCPSSWNGEQHDFEAGGRTRAPGLPRALEASWPVLVCPWR